MRRWRTDLPIWIPDWCTTRTKKPFWWTWSLGRKVKSIKLLGTCEQGCYMYFQSDRTSNIIKQRMIRLQCICIIRYYMQIMRSWFWLSFVLREALLDQLILNHLIYMMSSDIVLCLDFRKSFFKNIFLIIFNFILF